MPAHFCSGSHVRAVDDGLSTFVVSAAEDLFNGNTVLDGVDYAWADGPLYTIDHSTLATISGPADFTSYFTYPTNFVSTPGDFSNVLGQIEGSLVVYTVKSASNTAWIWLVDPATLAVRSSIDTAGTGFSPIPSVAGIFQPSLCQRGYRRIASSRDTEVAPAGTPLIGTFLVGRGAGLEGVWAIEWRADTFEFVLIETASIFPTDGTHPVDSTITAQYGGDYVLSSLTGICFDPAGGPVPMSAAYPGGGRFWICGLNATAFELHQPDPSYPWFDSRGGWPVLTKMFNGQPDVGGSFYGLDWDTEKTLWCYGQNVQGTLARFDTDDGSLLNHTTPIGQPTSLFAYAPTPPPTLKAQPWRQRVYPARRP